MAALSLRKRLDQLVSQSYSGPVQFFQESVRQFLLALETLQNQSDPVLKNLSRIQEDPQPLKSHAQLLANSLRDYI
jgi:hypothetical protein